VANARALSATVDTARASADAAKRQVAQAEARLAQAQAQAAATRSTPQQIAAQRARAQSTLAAVGAKQAAAQQAQLNLQYTTVTAPVSGVVGQRAVQVGQQIQPGQELMSVIPLNDLWVTADFKETQLQNMKVGQPVTIHVDATGQDFKGHVDSFPGATGAKYSLLPPENATGNFVKVVQRLPVRIFFEQGEDPQHRLRPGMSVEAKVRVK
jgi:membrane fusion protein (multidrug efflux system)